VLVRVAGKESGDKAEFLFGKMAPDFAHIYMRLPPSPAVHLAAGMRRADLDRPVQQWRDRRLVVLGPSEEIDAVRSSAPTGAFELRKSSDGWLADGRAADRVKADTLVTRFQNFGADDFIDPPASLDLAKWGLVKPSRVISLVTSKGRTVDLRFGADDASARRTPVQRGAEDVLFWVPDYAFEDFPKSAKDLLPDTTGTPSK
jgi:hypothetical protein